MILCNPKKSFESLITCSLPTLNLLSLFSIKNIGLTGNHTKIERKLQCSLRIFSPQCCLFNPNILDVTSTVCPSLSKLVKKSCSDSCIRNCTILCHCAVSACAKCIGFYKSVHIHIFIFTFSNSTMQKYKLNLTKPNKMTIYL